MKGLALAAAAGLFVTATIATAQETSGYPDMRGQWKGTSESIVLGSGMYHRDGKAGEPRMVSREFTFNAKRAEDSGETSLLKTMPGRFSASSPATSKPCTSWTMPEDISRASSPGLVGLRCAI